MDIQVRLSVLLAVFLTAVPLMNCAPTEDNEVKEIAKGLLAAISKRNDIQIEKRGSCGEDLDAKSETQTFSNPRGDDDKYSRFMSCKWVITAPEGQNVKLHFTDFKLENRINGFIFGDFCGDAVEIYDGENDEANRIGQYCGEETPPDVTSSGNKLYITFSSDFNKQERGFDATFQTVGTKSSNHVKEVARALLDVLSHQENKEVEKRDSCGAELDATNSTQSFSTPRGDNGKYPRFSSCKWVITAPQGQHINLHFTDFKLENRINGFIFGDFCGDAVEIYDGENDEANQIGQYCGEETPPDVTSSGNKLYITFSSDFNKQERGFDATFQAD